MSKSANEGVFLRRTLEGFEWASDYDRELGQRWGIGSLVRADIHQPRSGKHQRWFWALIRTVWHNQDYFLSPEALHRALQYRLGEYDRIQLKNGEIIIDFWSTGYRQLNDEGQFKEHVDRCWQIIATEIIPGLDESAKQELIRQIDKLLVGSLK